MAGGEEEMTQATSTPRVRKRKSDSAPGEGLAKLLHEHFQKSYDREIEDNETLWRSLPLFAALLGFAGTIVSFLANGSPGPERGWLAYTVYALIGIAALSFLNAIRHLTVLIWPRIYRYLPKDDSLKSYAAELLAYHEGRGLAAAEADRAAEKDLRDHLVNELAEAAAHNQQINRRRADARAQTLTAVFVGLIFSFLASGTILVDEKLAAAGRRIEVEHGARAEPAGSKAAE
jgi:hypothetical protein